MKTILLTVSSLFLLLLLSCSESPARESFKKWLADYKTTYSKMLTLKVRVDKGGDAKVIEEHSQMQNHVNELESQMDTLEQALTEPEKTNSEKELSEYLKSVGVE